MPRTGRNIFNALTAVNLLLVMVALPASAGWVW
jgi:hypothetical protein